MRINYLIIIILLTFSACRHNENNKQVQEFKFPITEDILVGLGSPITLNPDETVIHLRDFFPVVERLDSVIADQNLSVSFDTTTLITKLKINSDALPYLSVLKVYFGSIEYALILKRTKLVKHKFQFNPKGKDYAAVQLKGEMNAWNADKTPYTYSNRIWETEIEVEAGNYQYVLVLNENKEIRDPANPDSVSNGMGGFNSIIKIGNIDKTKIPRLYTKSHSQNIINIGTENNPSKLIVLYQNYLLNDRFVNKTDSGYRIIIPGDAKDQKRTHIRVFSYNDEGISNDLLIPIEKGNVLTDVSQLDRSDFHAAVIYNTFTDRFKNGDTKNDRPLKDKSVHPKVNYYGGDIAGITQKIEDGYFDSLGINTIWMSPVVKNPEKAYGSYPTPKTKFSAYHGYWPVSFTQVDDRMGTETELKKLVKTAHAKNINVLLDFVANHVHEEHPYYKNNKDNATPLYLEDGTQNTRKWDEYRLTTWFDVFLPTLNLEKPEVYNMLSDSAVYWIDKYDFDGFRHDACKHVPEIFWQTLTQKLKAKIIIPKHKPLYQIGESYGSPQLISSYVNSGMLDAQFDFNMYDALVGGLIGGNSFTRFADVITASAKFYGSHHLMGNITGNQDRARFISYADSSISFAEDAKLAGWTRKIETKGTIGFQECKVLNTVIAGIPGIPVIYYGDEIGLPGGNDPDNRRMMKFDNLNENEADLLRTTQKIINFRRHSLALIYGDMQILQADNDILIIERQYFDKIVYIIVNKSKTAKTISIPTKQADLKTLFGTTINPDTNHINIKLNSNSSEIIYN